MTLFDWSPSSLKLMAGSEARSLITDDFHNLDQIFKFNN